MGMIKHIPCSVVKVPQVATFTKESGNLEQVKIVVMHSGLNFNKTDISDSAVEEAKDTISNVPILAFIQRDEDGEAIDFDQHNVITKITQGENGHEVKQFYLEKPIGVIPETNNYRVEEIDGVNHVVVDGYIWKCYANEGYDLISDAGEKGVSMEIMIEDGENDKKTGVYHIKKYSYLGVTVLGDDVTPAMGSTCKLETYSSNEEFKFAMEELNKEVQKYQKEVGTVENTQENKEPVVDPTQTDGQEPVAKEPEGTFAQEPTEPVVTGGNEGEEPEKQNFSLSVENMSTNIRNTLNGMKIQKKYRWDDETYEAHQFYLRTIIPSENVAILEDNSSDNYTYFGVPFSLQGDNVALDFENKSEYIQTWRAKENGEEIFTFSEKKEEEDKVVNDKFSQMEATIADLTAQIVTKDSEIEGLKAFKLEKDQEALSAEVESIVSNFSILEEDEYKDLKEKTLNREIEIKDFKMNMYALKGMKLETIEKEKEENAKFSTKKGDKSAEPARVFVSSQIEPSTFSVSSRYGDLEEVLKRVSGKK